MPVLELDTASLRGPERFGPWAETIAAAFGPFCISRNNPERFHGRVRVERRQATRFIESMPPPPLGQVFPHAASTAR